MPGMPALEKVQHPADRCPSCNRPLASEHRQLRKRIFICPKLARGWRFAVDGRNRLVVMAIARGACPLRAIEVVEKSEAEGRVHDGPGTQLCEIYTPLLHVPKAQHGLIYMPAKRRRPKILRPS
jgi:hypothetical protein